MKLHLGCGHNYLDGWINVDGPQEDLCYKDIHADIYSRIEDLEYPDNSIDEILMNAVFEHFPRHIAIIQLRKFYKWLKPEGVLTILVPDFWGTVKMLKKSNNPIEQQFWFRHLYGPQDTIQFGTHYDTFDIDKLKYIFSIVGFNKFDYERIKRWPSIRFSGIKCNDIKSDDDARQSIIYYLANYENKYETGIAFNAWITAIGLKSNKPITPTFKTHELYLRSPFYSRMLEKIRKIITSVQ